MVDLAGDDSPYKQSVDNSVLLVAAAIVMAVFGKLKKNPRSIKYYNNYTDSVILLWLLLDWLVRVNKLSILL